MGAASLAADTPAPAMIARPAAGLLRRLLFLSFIAAYYGTFIWTYDIWLEPLQGFWGFSQTHITWEYQLLNWLMVLLPGCWLPLELRRPSQLLLLFQYLVMFVPATVVLYNSGLPPLSPPQVLQLLLVMFVSLSLMQAIYLLPLLRLPEVRIAPRVFWTGFYSLFVVLAVTIVAVLGQNLQFKGLEAIYSVRFDAQDLIDASGVAAIGYLVTWFTAVFLPVTFAVAVVRRSLLLLLLVTAGYLFLFGILGTKTALLGVVILWALSQIVRLRGPAFSSGFVIGLSALLLVPLAFDAFGEFGELLQKFYVLFVHARIFGVPQLILGQYVAFFEQHPLTWWSHINGVNFFVDFPYTTDVPFTLGNYYYATIVGLNGGMWTEDGVGAGGVAAVLLVSLVAAPVLWIFDSMTARVAPAFVALASTLVALSFMNVPLTTTLLTGGMALLALVIYLMPPESGERVPRER